MVTLIVSWALTILTGWSPPTWLEKCWHGFYLQEGFPKSGRELLPAFSNMRLLQTHGAHHYLPYSATFLDQHSILSTLQHSFRKFYSCETQLLVTLKDLFSYRDKNIQIDLAVLDFSKAFYTVPHTRMLGKLSHYGIKGPVLRWIRAFLADTTQRVVIEGTHSPPTPVTVNYCYRASENNFRLQRKVWSPKCFLHSFIQFKFSASARRTQCARFSDALLQFSPVSAKALYWVFIIFVLYKCSPIGP